MQFDILNRFHTMKNAISITLFVLILSCSKEKSICNNAEVTFENVEDLIGLTCSGGVCHPGALQGGWAVLPDFTTYESILPYLESGTFENRINSTDSLTIMPPYFEQDIRILSEADLALLNDWICLGFPES